MNAKNGGNIESFRGDNNTRNNGRFSGTNDAAQIHTRGSTTPNSKPIHSRPLIPAVFVGNLSYFCEEQHLRELFAPYGVIEKVCVCRSNDQLKPLQYGFVTMSTREEAGKIVEVFHGSLFMGRKIRMSVTDTNGKPIQNEDMPTATTASKKAEDEGIQVHVSFCSFFPSDEVIGNLTLKPTEAFLRTHLSRYGEILDVTVKDYQQYRDTNMQEGYGFVTFSSAEEANEAVSRCEDVVVDGITLRCTITHRNRSLNGVHEPIQTRNSFSRRENAASVRHNHKNVEKPLTRNEVSNIPPIAVIPGNQFFGPPNLPQPLPQFPQQQPVFFDIPTSYPQHHVPLSGGMMPFFPNSPMAAPPPRQPYNLAPPNYMLVSPYPSYGTLPHQQSPYQLSTPYHFPPSPPRGMEGRSNYQQRK